MVKTNDSDKKRAKPQAAPPARHRAEKPAADPPAAPWDHWYDTILESIADGVFTVDRQWRITYFNRAAEEITGLSRDQVQGRHCWEVFHASICEKGCALRETLKTGRSAVNRSAYIVRNDGSRLPVSISTAVLRDAGGAVVGGVETFRDLSEVETLRKELQKSYTFCDIVSKNKRMREILDILPQVGASDATVVLQGESGTGKELFARAIHNLSERRQGPLVAVNCAALPDTLLESELFGHVAGAFTDARQDRKGRFGEADGGTLFLDEIGDISPKLQVKLLRVLEEHSFQPVGSSKTVTVDVRLVAATNKDLARLVEQGTFRQDLFYRLNVLMLELPALRERKEDIALLVDHFIMRFNEVQGKNITAVAPEAMRLLMQHDFPGNVRELANIIERAFVLCTGTVILPDHLPDHLRGRPAPPPAGSAPIGSAQPVSATDDSPAVSANGLQTKSLPQNPSSPNSLEEMEAQFIRDALIRNRGNKAQTARELGIHKTTLWRKMKRLEIPPDTGSRTS